ncbi:Retrovirus-related Pol polyprotein from transposon RE1 [Vitis vinifera]|uniref:Retrovirus-related Pol polyprotein from transposon RE1 n=1 Tax=Vitis vinifera TaxID=29760 RepID=A0A438FTZ5_VITVI|nr:Retrovirus-related Pol polyprotein from transposon RE1 [Vitis vinifera]
MSCGNTPSTALVSINAATQLPLNLTGSSIYPSWRTMFSTLLYGYDLIGYVDGTYPCPPEMIKMGDTFTPNPEHKIWKRQDSLLLHAIRESVDSTIAPLVASTTFAQEAWARLHTTYASKSKTRILGLREMLSQLIKENKSVVEYMTVIKTMTDELAIVGSPLGEEEMVISVLKGLGSEFKN